MICRPVPRQNIYELVEPLVFWVDYKRFEVPAGFKYSGSIPKIFWTILTNPYDPRCVRGFCIHDYLYQVTPPVCSRETADEKLRQCLINDGKDKESVETVYTTVRSVGWYSWRENRA